MFFRIVTYSIWTNTLYIYGNFQLIVLSGHDWFSFCRTARFNLKISSGFLKSIRLFCNTFRHKIHVIFIEQS